MIEIIVMVAIFIIMIIYICWALNDLVKTSTYKRNKNKMFHSLESTLLSYYKSSDTKECFVEIDLIFKHIVNNDELLKRYYPNVCDLLEKYIICLNSHDEKNANPNVEDKTEYKKYILDLMAEYGKKNPMECIKGANNVLLNQLIECMKKSEYDKFNEVVNQLAVEIKRLEDEIFDRDKTKRKQDAISLIGIILSIVFGIMTFAQFFIK